MIHQNIYPKHWKVVPIKNVVFFQEGPGVRKFQYTESGVKLLNGGNINDGNLNLNSTERFISKDEAYGKYKHFLVDENDLLIACSGVVVDKFDGKIAYALKEHLPLCMNTSTMRFKTLDATVLDLDYFRRFLATNQFKSQLQKLITGSAQLNFGPSHIEQMYIPLPPLEEQKRIATALDIADAIRRKRQQAIKLTDKFLRSAFLEMFGDPMMNSKAWPIRPLGQVAPPTPVRGVTVSIDDDVWLLNLENIESNTGRILAEYKCKYGDVGNSTHWFDQNHVLYSKLRPYLNKVVLPLSAGIATSELLPLKPNPAVINREYLAYFLRSDSFVKWADSKVAGAKMPRLSPSELQNLSIPIPPMDIQNHFRNIVNQVTILKSKFETFGIQNENLFNALSQKAFAGEL